MKITKGVLAAIGFGFLLLVYSLHLIALHQTNTARLNARAIQQESAYQPPGTEQNAYEPSALEGISAGAMTDHRSRNRSNDYYQYTENCPPLMAPNGLIDWDLVQQCRMAIATEDVRFWTMWGVIIGGAGFIAIIITLGLNTKVTQATVSAARAAAITAQQDRAWVTSIIKGDSIFHGQAHDPELVQEVFKMQNTGKTPAFNFKGAINSSPINEDWETHFAICAERVKAQRNGKFLAPGEDAPFIWKIPRDRRQQLYDGIEYLVNLQCRYETLYGETYIVERTYRAFVTMEGTARRLNFHIHGPRNYIDRIRTDAHADNF